MTEKIIKKWLKKWVKKWLNDWQWLKWLEHDWRQWLERLSHRFAVQYITQLFQTSSKIHSVSDSLFLRTVFWLNDWKWPGFSKWLNDAVNQNDSACGVKKSLGMTRIFWMSAGKVKPSFTSFLRFPFPFISVTHLGMKFWLYRNDLES